MTTRLIAYPEQRALEDAAYAGDVVPTRIFAILLPIWCVEVRATITVGEDYELIDRYLEKAMAEAGLHTVAELAGFFALDQMLVDRALRFLTAIGHVVIDRGRFTLTELGMRSVRDQKRYRVTRHDRCKLYFDAYGSRPLPQPYYDSAAVTLLTPTDLSTLDERDGPRFAALANITRGFRRAALTELASNPDRDAFNLPERIDDPESVGEEYRYLPLYLVRGLDPGGQRRYLAYGQASDEADPYLSALCERTPEIVGVCESDALSGNGIGRERITEWLRKRNLDGHELTQTTGGVWRVTVGPSAFAGRGPLGISQLGSYIVLGNGFFRVWCGDPRTRRRALVERINAYLGARPHIDTELVHHRLGRLSNQLELDADLTTLRRWAVELDKPVLAEQLEALG